MTSHGTRTPPDTDRLIRVRRAATADHEALARMFERCALETRYRRFHGPVKAIPARYLADALSGSPFHHALVACPVPAPGAVLATGAVPAPDPDSCAVPGPEARADGIVALASCRAVDEGAAELGLLIEDAWQHQGLGARLLRDLVAHARRTGLRVLEAQLLAEQAWIAGLLRPYGTCRLRSTGDGVLNVSVRLGEGPALSAQRAQTR
jgi:GNAT superfamily N-acetyltransferase